MKQIKSIVLMLLIIFNVTEVIAVTMPRGIGNEQRIKIINYKPNAVFRFVGHYTYQSIIEFSLDEEVQTISMGTPTPWQIIPAGNRIFLKPIDDDATTNMTVLTNKRMYFFEMVAAEADSIEDGNISFIVKFVYPDDGVQSMIQNKSVTSVSSIVPDKILNFNLSADTSQDDLTNYLSNVSKYNFNYRMSGPFSEIEPLQVFDDGEFTYFKFRNVNAEIPAIFLVYGDQSEGLVNYRVVGDYVVVERVAAKFTLRHGSAVICVFNEVYNTSAF